MTSIVVLNLATVDVHGCDYITTLIVHCLHILRFDKCKYCSVQDGVYFHIGVGSNVVCSTTIGNARASIRGTDDGSSHAFLCDIENSNITKKYIHG